MLEYETSRNGCKERADNRNQAGKIDRFSKKDVRENLEIYANAQVKKSAIFKISWQEFTPQPTESIPDEIRCQNSLYCFI